MKRRRETSGQKARLGLHRVVNYAQWRSAEEWESLITLVGIMQKYYEQLGRFGKLDAHLYDVVHIDFASCALRLERREEPLYRRVVPEVA